MRDAVKERQRSLGVDFDDVVVELHACVNFRFDVGAFLVGIETMHPSTLEVGPDRIVSLTN